MIVEEYAPTFWKAMERAVEFAASPPIEANAELDEPEPGLVVVVHSHRGTLLVRYPAEKS